MSNPQTKKDAMGKGIRSLLQGIDADMKTQAGALKAGCCGKNNGHVKSSH